jgi:hypothetical protein
MSNKRSKFYYCQTRSYKKLKLPFDEKDVENFESIPLKVTGMKILTVQFGWDIPDLRYNIWCRDSDGKCWKTYRKNQYKF